MSTPWRTELYREISKVGLNGRVLDLGGSKKSGYHELISGDRKIEVVNIDDKYGFDFNFDLEGKFPIHDSEFDGVLAINVLEHIYNYKQFLGESFRIIKSGGTMVIGVPFLIQVHPCPHDYWRYSAETLHKIISEAGFKDIHIQAVGRGPLTATAQILNNYLKLPILRTLYNIFAQYADYIFGLIIDKKKMREEYVLGYFITAKK
jgi:hypothetical protein